MISFNKMGVNAVENHKGDKLPKEASVQIENVNFQVLITFQRWSGKEIPTHEPIMHNHVFYELFVCKQGEIRIKSADGDILLRAGDIALIPPAKAHILKHTGQDTEGYIIPFLCKKVNCKSGFDLYKKLTPIINNEIHIFKNCPDFIFETERIVEEFFSGSVENFLVALYLLELFLKMVRVKKNRDAEAETDTIKDDVVANDIERMMKLDSMIANRYLQQYSASDYAKELFISTRQLDRIVIKRYGKSLHQLIVDRRFAFAEQLLSTTDLTIEVIASSAGFSSSASLYREFKKRYGMTPAAFRKA